MEYTTPLFTVETRLDKKDMARYYSDLHFKKDKRFILKLVFFSAIAALVLGLLTAIKNPLFYVLIWIGLLVFAYLYTFFEVQWSIWKKFKNRKGNTLPLMTYQFYHDHFTLKNEEIEKESSLEYDELYGVLELGPHLILYPDSQTALLIKITDVEAYDKLCKFLKETLQDRFLTL